MFADEPIAARLGDIDESGRAAVAMQYDEAPAAQNPFPGGIRFFVSLASPVRRTSRRALPHIDGEHCAVSAAVDAPPSSSRAECTVSASDGAIVVDCCSSGADALGSVSLVDATGATLGRVDAGGDCSASIALPPAAHPLFLVITRGNGASELVPVTVP